jgi:hypothetical protein
LQNDFQRLFAPPLKVEVAENKPPFKAGVRMIFSIFRVLRQPQNIYKTKKQIALSYKDKTIY